MTDTQSSKTAASHPERDEQLSAELLLQMHDVMVEARALEERLIRMQRQGEGYFWIGGPGEEAFNTPLGLLVKKGQGLDYDYLHLHYRSSATLLAMGADPINPLRQMRNRATDPYSGGRNFAGHYSIREWNVCPVSSPIEVQYPISIGTAVAQARGDYDGITIVQGGDAGTAEGDFASSLVWASRPGHELPLLIIVTNNHWGISTPYSEQHGEQHIADRGKPFGMRTAVVDGNDPVASYRVLRDAMHYVRTERKPMVLEAYVSRLYGHSSSSGANYHDEETDCLDVFEERLERDGLRTRAESKQVREQQFKRMQELARSVKDEPRPTPESIWEHVFAERNVVAGEGGES